MLKEISDSEDVLEVTGEFMVVREHSVLPMNIVKMHGLKLIVYLALGICI